MPHVFAENLKLVRVDRSSDAALLEAWELYESSFPRKERRSRTQHLRAMEDPAFVCLVLQDGQGMAGLLFVWETDAFVFVEHLAVQPTRRGRGIGHSALELLHQRAGARPVILEIEPVVDEATARRCRFYESCGYVRLPYPHEQLPFHVGEPPVPLTLLSFPRAVSETEVAAFETCLQERIMRYRDQ